MKLRETQNFVEKGNLSNEHKFNVNVSGKAFSLLSNGIYSNKILAVVRELACNAQDANFAAGKNEPIEVHLPNSIEPWFSVKDNGVGMSEEDVFGLFSTYFETTKQDTNHAIGAFGLGSKSPFAYTSKFTITSRYNGLKTTYAAFIESDNVPKITKLGEQETDSENGVEVYVAVKEKDFTAFEKEAAEALARFNPFPKITGNKSEKVVPVNYIVSGKDWGVRNDPKFSREKAKAIQGGVVYPIDPWSIVHNDAEIAQEIEKICNSYTFNGRNIIDSVKIENLLLSNVDLYFEIGELDVALSREHLSYDKETKKAIIQKSAKTIHEYLNCLSKEIESQNTYYDACLKAKEIYTNKNVFMNRHDSLIKNLFVWKNMPVQLEIAFERNEFSDDFEHKIFGGIDARRKQRYTPKNGTFRFEFQFRNSTIFINDVENQQAPNKRILEWIKRNNLSNHFEEDYVIFIRNYTNNDIEVIKQKIPGIKIHKTSEIPHPGNNQKKSVQTKEVRVYELNKSFQFNESRDAHLNSKNWLPTGFDIDDINKNNACYVLIKRWLPIEEGDVCSRQPTIDFLGYSIIPDKIEMFEKLQEKGYAPNIQIYGIYPKYKNKAEELGLKSFNDAFQEALDNLQKDQKLLQKILISSQYFPTIIEELKEIKGDIIRNLPENHILSEFIDKYYEAKDLKNDNEVYYFKNVIKHIKMNCSKPNPNLEEYANEVIKRYPMLIYAIKGIDCGFRRYSEKDVKNIIEYIHSMDKLLDIEKEE